MNIRKYVAVQNSLFKKIRELDQACKIKNQYIGRYIINGFADSSAAYVIVDETQKGQYLLRYVCGEGIHPDWGIEIKLSKNKVEEMVTARDNIENIFPFNIF